MSCGLDEKIKAHLDEATTAWGIKVERVEMWVKKHHENVTNLFLSPSRPYIFLFLFLFKIKCHIPVNWDEKCSAYWDGEKNLEEKQID